jgi:predicted polyphosphate/ATP-dependent NAD kinase
LIATDVNENQLCALINKKKVKIIITVIGGQGHIFGRGNQQLSPRIIKKIGKENIIIIASKDKLISLNQAPPIITYGPKP